MLQVTMVIISIFVLMFKNYVTPTFTIITNISIDKFISPIPYLEYDLPPVKKTCAIAIATRITSYSYLIFFLFHKHNHPFLG